MKPLVTAIGEVRNESRKGGYLERLPFAAAGDEGEALCLDGHPSFEDVLLDVPVDEAALTRRVVAYQQHCDLLPRRQQVDTEALGDVDEA